MVLLLLVVVVPSSLIVVLLLLAVLVVLLVVVLMEGSFGGLPLDGIFLNNIIILEVEIFIFHRQ